MTQRQEQFLAALPTSWKKPLEEVCRRSEIDLLLQYLQLREAAGATIYPAKQNILGALQTTPFDEVKVVIVGQDPYHGSGQAHGLSFSVPEGIVIPPSLRNIFKELRQDLGIVVPGQGTLTGWARQGVLLLNAILTVEDGRPAAHAGKGWEVFTDAIIEKLLLRHQPIVLMLWGAYAQKKVQSLSLEIDSSSHLVLKAAHPSPLSVGGFLGCRHFSQTNLFLSQHEIVEIDWQNF